MKCNKIIEMSLKYLENSLFTLKRYVFKRHIEKCTECMEKFNQIKENYSPELELDVTFVDTLKNSVSHSIDKNKYSTNPKPNLYRIKWASIIIALVVFTAATVYAAPAFKTLEELINRIGKEPWTDYKKIKGSAGEKQVNYEIIADELYNKYKNEIENTFLKMIAGDTKTLKFDGEREDFSVFLSKGVDTGTITYSIDKKYIANVPVLPGDYKNVSTNSPFKQQESIEEKLQKLINYGYFIPMPQKLPDGYKLYQVESIAKKIVFLMFQNAAGDTISIDMNSIIVKDNSIKSSLEKVNDTQAIYQEHVFGDGRIIKRAAVYLGDDKLQQVFTISAQGISKEDLLDIAGNIKLYNEKYNYPSMLDNITEYKRPDKNIVKNEPLSETGRPIAGNDPRIINSTPDYLSLDPSDSEKMKKLYSNSQSSLIINENIKIERLLVTAEGSSNKGKNFYYIKYEKPDLKEIKEYYNYPLLLNKNILNIVDNLYVIVNGVEYYANYQVQYCFAVDSKYAPENTTKRRVQVSARAADPELEKYEQMDIMLDRYSYKKTSSNTTERLVTNNDGNAYIITEFNGDDLTYIETIIKIDGKYVEYGIFVPKYALDLIDELTFIN